MNRSMHHRPDRVATGKCALTGALCADRDLIPLDSVHRGVEELIRLSHPGLTPDAMISRSEIAKYRARYVEAMLRSEKGELSDLERQVARSIAHHDTLAENISEGFQERRTFGQRLSDGIANFGGSWSFVILFISVMIGWIVINKLPLASPFDPFPFILLNLVLSFIAALQAPVIMMSQKRQEAKDRLRSMSDYRVNLKAELEIRHLHEKLDHLLSRQWQRLADIQQLQIGLMEELTRANTKR